MVKTLVPWAYTVELAGGACAILPILERVAFASNHEAGALVLRPGRRISLSSSPTLNAFSGRAASLSLSSLSELFRGKRASLATLRRSHGCLTLSRAVYVFIHGVWEMVERRGSKGKEVSGRGKWSRLWVARYMRKARFSPRGAIKARTSGGED